METTVANGIKPYDLGVYFCEECGYAKRLRLLGYLTGCVKCDEVVRAQRWEPYQPLRKALPHV